MTQTLKDIGLPPLHQRRLFNRLAFFHKIAYGLVPAIKQEDHLQPLDNKRRIRPTRYTGYLSKNPIEHQSRNNSKCYVNIESRCVQYKNSFFPKTIIDWNSLDNSIVIEPKEDAFKNKLKKHMFD